MAELSCTTFGQVNLGHSSSSAVCLTDYMSRHSIPLVFVQEQYIKEWILHGSGASLSIVEKGPRSMAGFLFDSSKLCPLLLDGLSDEFRCCVVLRVGGREIVLISVYFRYSDPVGIHLRGLGTVLDALRGRSVIVAGDFNARSPLWHDRPTSDQGLRGGPVAEFISSYGLNILNRAGQPATFANHMGESCIDLTLCTDDLVSLLSDWKVLEGAISCDHRLIVWSAGGGLDSEPYGMWSFKRGRVNWDFFGTLLRREMSEFDFWLSNGADVAGEKFNDAVVDVASMAIGRCRPRGGRFTAWWTPELTALKRQFKAAERAFGPVRKGDILRDSPAGVALKSRLRQARGSYHSAIRLAKSSAWKEWITETGNADPWSISRTAAKTRKSADHYLTSIVAGGGETTCIDGTLRALLDGLVPLDSALRDTPHQCQLRILSRHPPVASVGAVSPVTHTELGEIVKTLGPRKAPGIDRIHGDIVKKVWHFCPDVFVKLMNVCLTEGVFPKVWKRGLLKVIPKGNDKQLSDLKAYRPITLLPSFGKVLEILLRNRLAVALSPGSDRQFGFSRGKSTEHAIQACLDWRDACTEKLVLGVFLDIAGAFDNAWWPMILSKLKLRGCPRSLFLLVSSYFSDRKVVISHSGRLVERVVDMGCPQGSVLGPFLWNVLFDDLLKIELPTSSEILAYADDALLLLGGRSRLEIEQKFSLAVDKVLAWGRLNRLTFSPAKTSAMWMKGTISRSRHPVLRMDGSPVRVVDEVRYLGVLLDRGFSFLPHVKAAATKASVLFMILRRISRGTWGLRSGTMRAVYRATYVPQVAYAARVWSHRLSVGSVVLAVLRGQRLPLLAVTGAYRTSATDGLPVIAGVLPADLEILDLAARKSINATGSVTHHGSAIVAESGREGTNRAIRLIRERTMDVWQERWNSGGSARLVYRYFPDVRERMSKRFVRLDHFSVQLITGHGELRGKLCELRLSDDPWCPCGLGAQFAEHILWECPILMDARERMLAGMSEDTPRPIWFGEVFRDRNNMACFLEFVDVWVSRWEVLRQPGVPPDDADPQ